ncbi:hypothetical protein AVEN_122346-1 [Araneus ventricosus]|uniref:Uncharacterized protein n=1 Tax=Araneus ventricosus TaxID=182803 RepID=A0A4Y2WSH0_ARAVE|nr:hypothetical protein AVEN_83552-1 [Araneus ventricosus]GBO40130.1 hypothetical protein AVEN_122346-1 [Araneus ventricosus]
MDPLWQRHLPKEKNHLLRRGPSTPDLSKSPFTSFDDVQHPQKTKTSVCPPPPTKRPAFLRHRQLRHFPLERSPKFRTRYFITSQ